MCERGKKNTRPVTDVETGKMVSVSDEEYEQIKREQEGDKKMGTTEKYKEKLEKIEERKAGLERQAGESDLDYTMRRDAILETARAEQEHKDRQEVEAINLRQKEAEQKDVRANQLYEAGFTGETELHKQIRQKLYAGGITEEERQKLREQYHLTPYEMPYTQTFRKTIILEYGEGLKIVSTDNGKHWSPRADIKYFKATPKLELDSSGKPTAYIFDLFNDSIYDFKKSAQAARVTIKLEEDLVPIAKIAQKPVSRVLPTCEEQGIEHKSIDGGKTCCLCGEKLKEK